MHSTLSVLNFNIIFALPENLDSTLLKLCKLILPSVHFSRLHDSLMLRTLLQRKKSQQYVDLHTEMGYTLVFLILGIYSLEPVARN